MEQGDKNNDLWSDKRLGQSRYDDDTPDEYTLQQKRNKKLAMIIGGVAVAVIAIVVAIVILIPKLSGNSDDESASTGDGPQSLEEAQQMIQQLELEKEMLSYENDFTQIDNTFNNLMEGQNQVLLNDDIVEKYQGARAEIERLMAELKAEKSKNKGTKVDTGEIQKLKDQIETLKGICRDYLKQIEELSKENQRLSQQNDSIRDENRNLSNRYQSVTQERDHLSERMTLAEKLNVTGLNLVALNKKGKNENNVTKAKRLMVTFTIPQNNSTPPGEKIIYLRITTPEGQLLTGNGGSFEFEGSSLQATARKSIEYANEEIGGLQIYWDVNTTLNPGDYRVELFTDGYRLASRNFTLRK